jgi:hypothetical protein
MKGGHYVRSKSILPLVTIVLLSACTTKRKAGRCDKNNPCAPPDPPVCVYITPNEAGFCMAVDGGMVDAAPGGDAAIDAALPADATIDAPMCTSSTSCPEATPICELTGHACRTCTAGSECLARDGARPYCVAGKCAACRTDTDCPSSAVCDEERGTCLMTSEVVYVATTGSDGTGCGTMATPCQTIGMAMTMLTGPRRALSLAAGTYTQGIDLSGKSAIVVGNGATIAVATTDKTPLAVTLGGHAQVRNLTLRGARSSGTGSFAGVFCGDIDTNKGTTCRLEGLTVTDNDLGVVDQLADLTIERSSITNNRETGLTVTGGTFAVTNNFITGNGGGVAIGEYPLVSGASGTFDFNTVAGNVAGSGTFASGVNNPFTLTFRNNIVWGNTVTANVLGGTVWEYSDVQGRSPTGPGNISQDPLFAAPSGSPPNYHLMSASPAKNAGDNTGAPSVDFDGDPRPSGTTVDMGADEVVP